MPSDKVICYYSMYVLGKVESGWNWSSINYNDAITVGMMQWWGPRAAGVLGRIKTEVPAQYPNLAASLRKSLEKYPKSNSNYWGNRYLTQTEGSSIAKVFKVKASHIVQENQAIKDFKGYMELFVKKGMLKSAPKPMIFVFSMYHQGPKYCFQVFNKVGSKGSLSAFYAECKRHPVFSKYKNRYNTVYNLLQKWDGKSMPPNFGQVGTTVSDNRLSSTPSTTTVGGKTVGTVTNTTSQGGNDRSASADTGTGRSKRRTIIQTGDNLYITSGD